VQFATTNRIKFEEAEWVFPGLEQMALELHEVQALDPAAVVEHKLSQIARIGVEEAVLVEDTALIAGGWDGLPGALVRWFVDRWGAQRLRDMLVRDGDCGAVATSAVGCYLDGEAEVWCGSLSGRLVDSRGTLGGWTSVFEVPEVGRTLGEMDLAERMRWTMRGEPLRAAKRWLGERE
jgi:inosine/xanthosine triphosphate pyrophosphatase family protein